MKTSGTTLKLVLIIASTRPGRLGPVVADWFVAHAAHREELRIETIDLAAHSIPSASIASSVGSADAVVVVTPEYNHSFPGPLKHAIDSMYEEWAYKPVAFVSYGGISGGLRAVEALRPVFAELNAVTIRETVSVANAWEVFDAEGPSGRDLNEATDRLLDQLTWWAEVLQRKRPPLRSDTAVG